MNFPQGWLRSSWVLGFRPDVLARWSAPPRPPIRSPGRRPPAPPPRLLPRRPHPRRGAAAALPRRRADLLSPQPCSVDQWPRRAHAPYLLSDADRVPVGRFADEAGWHGPPSIWAGSPRGGAKGWRGPPLHTRRDGCGRGGGESLVGSPTRGRSSVASAGGGGAVQFTHQRGARD